MEHARQNKSAYAALMSNISEKDKAKDVEQFDDVLRMFINDTNKCENRFGTISVVLFQDASVPSNVRHPLCCCVYVQQ